MATTFATDITELDSAARAIATAALPSRFDNAARAQMSTTPRAEMLETSQVQFLPTDYGDALALDAAAENS
ncbi:MAG: hypothetical protein MO846_01670 [Candidatus Devosia symbiotica]|nr:hypothetical protein [Candidatus Devosia symbiotica]